MNEVRILQSVNHPSVIKLEDVIDTTDYLFIVLELAEGGELFDKIIEKTKLDETVAKLYFYQIASAIKYLHSKVGSVVGSPMADKVVLRISVTEA